MSVVVIIMSTVMITSLRTVTTAHQHRRALALSPHAHLDPTNDAHLLTIITTHMNRILTRSLTVAAILATVMVATVDTVVTATVAATAVATEAATTGGVTTATTTISHPTVRNNH